MSIDRTIRPMGLSLSADYSLLLRASGVMAWLFTFILLLTATRYHNYHPLHSDVLVWKVVWLLFLVAIWGSTSADRYLVRIRPYMLALQVVLAFCMRLELPQVSVNFLLLIVTWQVVLYFSMRLALSWLGIQLLLYALIDFHQRSLTWITLSSLCIYFLFKAFTCGLIVVAKREGTMRLQQAQIIAEMKARLEFLAESSRMSERLRISRELHDALGHGLTALALHLEVALNETHPVEVASHVRKSQLVARGMLSDVREVVGSLRAKNENIDLSAVLDALVSDIPGLRVHLTKPASISLWNPELANILIRYVQEIITNTVKHAEARNLWLSMKIDDGMLRLTAADDGKGGYNVKTSGHGLAGMRERFHELGGNIEILHSSGPGFSVSAILPLRPLQVSL